MKQKYPLIGVGVVVIKQGRVLLGKRKGSHGAGKWSFPGGHLELGESISMCAQRELKEETGLEAENFQFVEFTNDIFKKENLHYITLFVKTEISFGEPEIREPDKCIQWQWFKWENLPEALFLPVQNLVDNGYRP
jgi:8-oxo-dGTP diphosphatase